jgi:alanyl-tRNA synthetase
MENENELEVNSENTSEEQETSTTPEDSELKEKNKQLFERAKKAEQEVKDLKAKFPVKEEPKIEPKGNTTDPKVLVKLSKALSGYDEEEIDYIYQMSKDQSPEAIIEATKNKWVQTAINANREKVVNENKVAASSNVPGGKSNETFNPADLDKDPDAHRKFFEEQMKKTQERGTGL